MVNVKAARLKSAKGFTLLELLIVIGIIAILSVALILVLNPAETLKKSRDVQRMADLQTMKTALGLYVTSTAVPDLDASVSNFCLTGAAPEADPPVITDSTDNTDNGEWNNTDSSFVVNFGSASYAELKAVMVVNDYLKLDNEIVQLMSISEWFGNPNNAYTFERARFSTVTAAHANGTDIYFYTPGAAGSGTAQIAYSTPDAGKTCTANVAEGADTGTVFSTVDWCLNPATTAAGTVVNGTGWIPVNLGGMTGGSPVSNLPMGSSEYCYVGNSNQHL